MSYDLLVFDPLAAPPDREGFLRWYAEQVTWHEGHSYDDPEVSTPALQAWYLEMRSKFPALTRLDKGRQPVVSCVQRGDPVPVPSEASGQ